MCGRPRGQAEQVLEGPQRPGRQLDAWQMGWDQRSATAWHTQLCGAACACVCVCRQGQWHTGSTPEVCALERGQRTVEGEGGSGACEPSINVMYFSTADLCSQEQPLGTRRHICLSYDLTEGQQSPSSSLSPTAELELDPKGPPGWSLSDIHIPLHHPARLGCGGRHISQQLWTQDCYTVSLNPPHHGWIKTEPQDSRLTAAPRPY